MTEIKDRVAFVTGGASGIGLGIARALIEAGATVVIADLEQERIDAALADLGASAARGSGVVLDVRDREAWRAAKAEAQRRHGPISLLFNNAGVTAYDPLIETSPDLWDWVIAVNLTGVFNGVSTFGRDMVERGAGGHIVNTASIAGVYGSNNMTVGAYIASKYGVVGMSERLRIELAPADIGVSILCPGLVQTRIGANTQRLRPGSGGAPVTDNPSFRKLRASAPVSGMSADKVGRFVLEAVRENRAYIFTHPEVRPLVAARQAAVLDGFGASADPDLALAPGWMYYL